MRAAIYSSSGGQSPGAANNLPPLSVLRERVGVRVISSTSDMGIPNHPQPNPLPEYRERVQQPYFLT
jgi:hypothetical protein